MPLRRERRRESSKKKRRRRRPTQKSRRSRWEQSRALWPSRFWHPLSLLAPCVYIDDRANKQRQREKRKEMTRKEDSIKMSVGDLPPGKRERGCNYWHTREMLLLLSFSCFCFVAGHDRLFSFSFILLFSPSSLVSKRHAIAAQSANPIQFT